ncbi:hypothetical protein B0T19DRAFT_413805 [Cercophora scortea]|uniref:Uncharacterized protein n=1 Tax=Cercophora scortea TaxID=314031 RepID=A0AAE0IUY8_9PEZI|nr:hypothetical protein B0T19DRAFT_413805 [Cercophora scortea]
MATTTAIAAAAPPPLPTPIQTTFMPALRALMPRSRFTNSTVTTRGPDCAKFDGFKTCSAGGDYGSCIAGNNKATSSCNCNFGVGYLDCLSAAIATSSCWGDANVGIASADWDGYERSWFQTSCAKPPATVMAELPQPTTVQIVFSSVNVVTPAAPVPPVAATQIEPPKYSGTGQLLVGACSDPTYTLIDGGDTVYLAAFVGCGADRPECCPWSVSSTSTTVTAARVTQAGVLVAGGAGNFPAPASGVQTNLARCPDDYYSVSGQCCPNGFYKFTSMIAHQTPCFSSLAAKVTPPPVTAGQQDNPTDTSKPTSAVVNIAWAMGYNVSSDAGGPALSKGATIGIGVGAGVVAIALVATAALVILRIRRNKKAALEEQAAAAAANGRGSTYMPDQAAPTVPVVVEKYPTQAYPQPTPVGGWNQERDQGQGQGYYGGGYNVDAQQQQQQQYQQQQYQQAYELPQPGAQQQPAIYEGQYRR